jgi:hypothetical protein
MKPTLISSLLVLAALATSSLIAVAADVSFPGVTTSTAVPTVDAKTWHLLARHPVVVD